MKLQEIRDKYMAREITNKEAFRALLDAGMTVPPANQTIQLWIADEVAKLKGIKWGGR